MYTYPHGRPGPSPRPPAGGWQRPAPRKPRLLRPANLAALLGACAMLGVGGGAGLVWATSSQQEDHTVQSPAFSPAPVASHTPGSPAEEPTEAPATPGRAMPLLYTEVPPEVDSFWITQEDKEGSVYRDRKGRTIYPGWANRDSGVYHADKKRAQRFLALEHGFCGSVDQRTYCAISHPSDPAQTLHFWSPDLSIAELGDFVGEFVDAWRAERFSPAI